jgi:hypothetical protein
MRAKKSWAQVRQEQEQHWSQRVPRELLVLGRVWREATGLVLQGEGPSHEPAVDWEGRYETLLAQTWRRLLSIMAPGDAPSPIVGDVQEDANQLDEWLRTFVRQIAPGLGKKPFLTREATDQVRRFTEKHLSQLRIELRVCLDQVVSIIVFRRTLPELIEEARHGDVEALEKVLRINPALQERPWIRDLAAQRVKADGLAAVGGLQRAVEDRLEIRQNKLLEISYILTVLWPWLRRLTTNQRRGFLKDLRLEGVPEKHALREAERRLKLKSLLPDQGTGDEAPES